MARRLKYKRVQHTVELNPQVKNGQLSSNVGYSLLYQSQGIGIITNGEFGGPLSSAINLDPITPIVITDPSVANAPPYSTKRVVETGRAILMAFSTAVEQEMSNPLAYIKVHENNYGWSDNIVGNAYLEVQSLSRD